MPDPILLTVKQAAKRLNMSTAWLFASDVPYVKLGSRRLYGRVISTTTSVGTSGSEQALPKGRELDRQAPAEAGRIREPLDGVPERSGRDRDGRDAP